MTQNTTPIEASLLYPQTLAPFDKVDTVALESLFGSLGAPVLNARQHGRDYALFDCATVQIAIVSCDVPFEIEHFEGVLRPQTDPHLRNAVLQQLSGHGSSITVIVADADGVPPGAGDLEFKQHICWETLDHLFTSTGPDLLFWSHDDRLMTPAEAEIAFGDLQPVAAGAAQNTTAMTDSGRIETVEKDRASMGKKAASFAPVRKKWSARPVGFLARAFGSGLWQAGSRKAT